MLYGFTVVLKNKSVQNEEQIYAGKLINVVGTMKTIGIDETTTLQKWHAGKIEDGAASVQFANFKSQRQTLDDDFFSRAAPKRFAQVHQTFGDANTLYMQADDLYRDGTFRRNADLISNGDAKAAAAKNKFDSALSQLEKLGYKL